MEIGTNAEEIEAWLLLIRTPGLDRQRWRAALAENPSAARVLARLRRSLGDLDPRAQAWLRAPDIGRIAADLDWLAQDAHSLVTLVDEDYPPLLRDLAAPPPALFIVGDASVLWIPQIAIVGSRNASHVGIANAEAFAHALAASGLVVTSGLADGIDGAAHSATLAAGGRTIAVFGTGADIVFPTRHRDLAARIAVQGALVSEFPPGTSGLPKHFPRRNRIIAGLSLGTLVVEASPRSGSLITARCAIDNGREVFAIPGSIHNPLARGCHELIRNGAKLVETAAEIITELAPLAARLGASLRERLEATAGTAAASGAPSVATRASARAGDPDYRALYTALGHDGATIDQLAERSGLAVATLSSMLLMLELEGEVVAEAGAFMRRG